MNRFIRCSPPVLHCCECNICWSDTLCSGTSWFNTNLRFIDKRFDNENNPLLQPDSIFFIQCSSVCVCCVLWFYVFVEHAVCVFHACRVFGMFGVILLVCFQCLLCVVGASSVCFVEAFEVVLLAAGLALTPHPLPSDHLAFQPGWAVRLLSNPPAKGRPVGPISHIEPVKTWSKHETKSHQMICF